MVSKTKTALSQEDIQRLVTANFGAEVRVKSVEEFPEGFFNAVYAISLNQPVEGFSEVVLKVGIEPGKHILIYEKDIMRAEIAVFKMLAERGVPVPKLFCTDFSRSQIPCDYFFMERLMGPTWSKAPTDISPENAERLQYQLGKYTAMMHGIKGEYFGYIKEDTSYHYPTWREAFRSFIENLIEDGRRDGVELPYDDVMETFEPHWHLLDEVTDPSLIHYDMWSKNILLIQRDGEYTIDGIIDLERAFYGDPIAEFISTNTICGDVSQAKVFQKGYSEVAGGFFAWTKSEQIRFAMYNVYMGLLGGVEVYRYDESETPRRLMGSRYFIGQGLAKIKQLAESK